MTIYLILAILISGLLFRVPRGGPSKEVWEDHFGFGGFGSTGGALIWAAFTACSLSYIFGLHWVYYILFTATLMLMEMPGWSQWWPNRPDGGSFLRLTLRGCLILNPLMGLFYFGFYKIRDRLPTSGFFIEGWTSYAEILSGIVTASVMVFLINSSWFDVLNNFIMSLI
ncbi:hypothetical protein CL614_10420 [archaeon]|nr:hypothetical protein [archaeon]|tara:strand:+ start:1361 stop:1867 length:507 start_codon:yes stop_codon:yes gene_type:complete